LIGKLDLLTRSLQTRFDEESTARLSVALDALDKADEMTEEDATRHMDGLNRLLSEKTKEMLVLFDLPRVAAPSGGAAGGRPGATDGGRQDSSSSPGPAATGGAATGAARNGAGQAASNENPFKQEDNAKRLKLLRELIRPSGAELSP
jgi:hypothetical protein